MMIPTAVMNARKRGFERTLSKNPNRTNPKAKVIIPIMNDKDAA